MRDNVRKSNALYQNKFFLHTNSIGFARNCIIFKIQTHIFITILYIYNTIYNILKLRHNIDKIRSWYDQLRNSHIILINFYNHHILFKLPNYLHSTNYAQKLMKVKKQKDRKPRVYKHGASYNNTFGKGIIGSI